MSQPTSTGDSEIHDLHSLVTTVPNPPFNAPTSWGTTSTREHRVRSPGVHSSDVQQAFSPIFNHSASIFSPDGDPQSDYNTLLDVHRPHYPTSRPASLATAMPGSSRPTPATHRTATNPFLIRAEKDTDDPNATLEESSRRGHERMREPTTTRINRLFSAHRPSSSSTSREHSFNLAAGGNITYTRAPTSATATLPNHLYQRGFLGGRHSDIKVKAFNKTYDLHRIILDRAPFFAGALSEPWYEAASNVITLHPEDIDNNITKTTFELALKRLYGVQDAAEEEREATGLFATGCWLEMDDLVRASVDALLRSMHPRVLPSVMHLVTSNYYGKSGDRILLSAKSMLCRDGWEMPLSCWDGISSDIILDVVGSDGFYVLGEWERWGLAKRLLDRRLKRTARSLDIWPISLENLAREDRLHAWRPPADESQTPLESPPSTGHSRRETDVYEDLIQLYSHPEITPLLRLIDRGVHYAHLEFEQMQHLRNAKDAVGLPLLTESVLTNALWMGVELRQRIMNASHQQPILGLSEEEEDDDAVIQTTSQMGYVSLHASNKASGQENDKHTPTDLTTDMLDGSIPRRYGVPTHDCSIVIGGSGEPQITATGQAQRPSHAPAQVAAGQSHTQIHVREATQSGETEEYQSAAPEKQQQQQPPKKCFSTMPPFRFAAEFPHPRMLKEKKRVYSKTYFYAGSFWNVYIQKVKSGNKNPQLGVYLHRAKERESDVLSNGPDLMINGTVDERIGFLEREMQANAERWARIQRNYRSYRPPHERFTETETTADGSGSDAEVTAVSGSTARRVPYNPGLSTFMTGGNRHRMDGRHSLGSPPGATALDDSSSRSSMDEEDDPMLDTGRQSQTWFKRSAVRALPAYVDARPTVTTYFKIYSPSKGGRMLSVYESAPDFFDFSQSWGWKSSTLMVDDDEEVGLATGDAGLAPGLDEDLGINAAGGSSSFVNEDGELLGSGKNTGEDDILAATTRARGNGRLRFMVVLGVV